MKECDVRIETRESLRRALLEAFPKQADVHTVTLGFPDRIARHLTPRWSFFGDGLHDGRPSAFRAQDDCRATRSK